MDFVVIVWASHLVTLFKKNFMVCIKKNRVEDDRKSWKFLSIFFNLGSEENHKQIQNTI